MKILDHTLGKIKIPGPNDSLDGAYRLQQRRKVWAADTETTGLDIYSKDYRVRIVQVGTTDEAWILRPDFPSHRQAIKDLTGGNGKPVEWHNWVFDALSLEESCDLDFATIFKAANCTDIRSRLVDPRPPMKGGVGHKLKDLGERYVMKGVKDARAEVLHEGKRLFGARNFNKDNMWKQIPIDNTVYLLYAGQDVFLTARLAVFLEQRIKEKGLQSFYAFERPLSYRLAQMQRVGVAFDPVWAAKAEREFDLLFEENEQQLIKLGIDKRTATYAHSSNASLKDRFRELGVIFVKKTKTGDDALDKSVIAELTLHRNPEVRELAKAVFLAKRNKHYGDYIRGMRDTLGADGRIHPNIRPMQAATHRMSMSDPPIQQFPRGDPRPRGCIVGDSGEVVITVDYAQVEFRTGAAASQDPVMVSRIMSGEDLHKVTATALFGPDFNRDQRQASKPIGFGRLYLGGASGIWRQMVEADTTGYVPSVKQVSKAIKAFDRDYKAYVRWAYRLKDKVEKDGGHMTTATGRQLIVSPYYAAPNYYIQSTARDIFARGINEAWKRGIGEYIRLVVHDEVVAMAPRKEAKAVMKELQDAMTTTFKGIPFTTEGEVKGKRWAK